MLLFCVALSATRGKPSTWQQQLRLHAMITLCCLGLPGITYFSASFDIYLWWLSYCAMWWYLYHYSCYIYKFTWRWLKFWAYSVDRLCQFALFHRDRSNRSCCARLWTPGSFTLPKTFSRSWLIKTAWQNHRGNRRQGSLSLFVRCIACSNLSSAERNNPIQHEQIYQKQSTYVFW